MTEMRIAPAVALRVEPVPLHFLNTQTFALVQGPLELSLCVDSFLSHTDRYPPWGRDSTKFSFLLVFVVGFFFFQVYVTFQSMGVHGSFTHMFRRLPCLSCPLPFPLPLPHAPRSP